MILLASGVFVSETVPVHSLTLTAPVDLGKTLGILPAGEWIVEDLNAFEIAQMAPRGTATIDKWNGVRLSERDGPTLVMRSGAIGDLLMLSPLFKEWMMQTNTVLHLCCFAHHHAIFKGEQWIGGLVPYPLPELETWKYGRIISLENTIESDHSMHATDVFAKRLGLNLERKARKLPEEAFDYRPRYFVTPDEKDAAKPHLFKKRPNLVIQPRASVPNRDYPLPLWIEVIRKLEQRGWGILLVGQKGQIPLLPPPLASAFVRDLSQLGLTFRESAAVLAQSDAFCGVDSAWAHMCHALDIPAVVLFGPFAWETRTSKAPKTIALSGVGPCAPCNWHMHAGRAFPPNKPCTARQVCVVLASIPPERIVAKVALLKS